MSIIFGLLKPHGSRCLNEELLHLAKATRRYAPDGLFTHVHKHVGFGCQPYYTHLRSELETTVARDKYDSMLILDGRLDNHADLCAELEIQSSDTPDSQIILCAFKQWGEDCFQKLVGDWALALWSERDQSLYLARDHAGSRSLYYRQTGSLVFWSTFLETFFADSVTPELNKDYLSRYLSCQPVGELTPYKGITAVRPAHYLVFHNGKSRYSPHWQWIVQTKIKYPDGNEYTAQFGELFRQSVMRRIGPGAPILAQLSGGMDSSSIVCMSDQIRRKEQTTHEELLDTISFYDDNDPNWNETPYFSAVEQQRGKTGIHLQFPLLSEKFEAAPVHYLVPGSDQSTYANELQLENVTCHKGYRVILAGFGGDELLGGIPTPVPELADYLVSCNLVQFFRRMITWCLIDRTPILEMTAQVARFIWDQYSSSYSNAIPLPPWCTPESLHFESPFPALPKLKSPRFPPSRIANGMTWWNMTETLPHLRPGSIRKYEYRYPYLDRDLVDFLLRIPREVLLQPGRRRALMRQAMNGIVPASVIERRRKGYRIRSLLATLRNGTENILRLLESSHAAELGLVSSDGLAQKVLEVIREGDPKWIPAIIRLIHFELWWKSARQEMTGTRTGREFATCSVAQKIRADEPIAALSERKYEAKENDHEVYEA